MDIKSFIGAVKSYDFDYYKQDLKNGGYKKATVNINELLTAAQYSVGHFAEGGWQSVTYPVTDCSHPYARVIYVPKLAPLVKIVGEELKVGGVTVASVKHFGQRSRYFRYIHSDIQNTVARISADFNQMNLDKDGWPRDPVPRNPNREQWVKDALAK